VSTPYQILSFSRTYFKLDDFLLIFGVFYTCFTSAVARLIVEYLLEFWGLTNTVFVFSSFVSLVNYVWRPKSSKKGLKRDLSVCVVCFCRSRFRYRPEKKTTEILVPVALISLFSQNKIVFLLITLYSTYKLLAIPQVDPRNHCWDSQKLHGLKFQALNSLFPTKKIWDSLPKKRPHFKDCSVNLLFFFVRLPQSILLAKQIKSIQYYW